MERSVGWYGTMKGKNFFMLMAASISGSTTPISINVDHGRSEMDDVTKRNYGKLRVFRL